MKLPSSPPYTLLDACAVLSLYATQRFADIVTIVPGPVAVADVVLQEALFIRRVVEDAVEREPVDLGPYLESGLLEVVHAESDEELLTFIDLAVDLDDGEAMTGALAIRRHCILVTDDRKAESLLAGHIQLRSTLELIRAWAEAERISSETLRNALFGVDQRGYRPPRSHPHKKWWGEALYGS